MSDNDTPKKILVVDDESHILHIVSLKFRNAGFEVHTAVDGEEGLDVAQQVKPDVIITDYQMPFMTGLEMCRKLKQIPATADIPVLMLTARGFGLNQQDIEHTNIVGMLSKPFSPREVLSKIKEMIPATAATD